MTDFSVGGLFAVVGIDTAPFDRALPRVVRQFADLGARAAKASAGTDTLDGSLAGVGASADKASVGVTRLSESATRAAAAETKVAAAAERHATATAAVNKVMTDSVGLSTRRQQLMLREVAAQDRLTAAQESGATTTRQLASAQAGLLAAQKRVADSSAMSAEGMVATGKKMSHAITLPVVALAAVSVDQAAKFQKSMTLIQTAGGETAQKATAIAAGIKKIAVETGTSLGQLGDGIYTVAKAGATKWSAAGQLEVLRAAAEGAKAEAVPLGTAVDALSTVMLDYGAKTSQAVQYQNMLIRGAGLAKTTMAQYAGALSNVVPIAAATGISFQEIGGAIATMTQHGVSAQQATENLRNLIINLAGQNNVASSAMQQLGINTVDLSRNLGKRGLSGTLAIVDKALAQHTHDGMVVVDVHKAATLATKSLNTEMGTFTGKLADQSKGLLAGNVGITAYTKYAKSLGGTAGASALQFLALYKSSQGFSDQLKSGKGTITTTVAALNKMLGGITGTSVALQIGGKYADQNARNVRELGKAYLTTGSDVLGWNKTQDTLAQKMDKAKASLQVMAVEIGTALIPAVSKIATEGEKAAHWFDGLSGTQKEVLGWSIGILAAIGPIMGIGGRLMMLGSGIGRAASFIGSGLSRIVGASSSTSLAVGRSMGLLSSAIGGASIGLAVGTLTEHSSTAVKAIGAIGSAAAGAAIGFGAGGPIGAAIGGGIGLVTSLATAFSHSGDAAKAAAAKARAALQSQTDAANQLEQSLEAVNAAYDAQYRRTVAQSLTKTNVGGTNFNVLKLGTQAGISPNALLNQAIGTGTPKALDEITAKLRTAMLAGKLSETEWDAVATALGIVGSKAKTAEQNTELQAEAMKHNLVPANQLGISLKKLGAATQGTGTALSSSSAAGLRNEEIIRENVVALNSGASAALKYGKNHQLLASSVRSAASAYEAQIGSLRKNLTQMGFNGAEIDKIIGKYGRVPKSVATELRKRGVVPADIQAIIDKYFKIPPSRSTNVLAHDHASAVISQVRGELNNLNGSTANVYIATTKLPGGGQGSVKFQASGGYITGPGTGTSDSIPARLSNGEFVVRAAQTAKHLNLLHAINSGAQGFAAGGLVGGTDPQRFTTTQLTSQLISAVHELRTSLTATLRSVGASLHSTFASARGTVMSVIAASVAPQSTDPATLARSLTGLTNTAVSKQQAAVIATANYNRLAAVAAKLAIEEKASAQASKAHALQLSNEAHAAATAAANISSTATAAKHAAEVHARALATEARAASQAANASAAASKNRTAALKAEATAAAAAAAKAKTASDNAKQAAKDAADAAAQEAQSLVSSVQSAVDAMSQAITDFKSTIAQGITGDTSITSIWQSLTGTDANGDPMTPTLAGLQAGLDAALAKAQKFAADLKQLTAEGAGQDLITQLAGMSADAGDALAQQLIAGGPAAVAALQKTMTALTSVANQTANSLATSFYGPGESAMQQFIDGMVKKFPELKKALTPIVQQIITALTGQTITPPSAASVPVPKFASGVTNFAGGLAYVHRDEMLVNLPPRTDVIPRTKTPQQWGGGMGGDVGMAMLQRLNAIERHLAVAPQRIGSEVSRSGADLYNTAGLVQADRLNRLGRKR